MDAAAGAKTMHPESGAGWDTIRIMKLKPAVAITLVTIFAQTLCAQTFGAQTFPAAAELDTVIGDAIREDRIPGAVLLIGHQGKVVYRKAYGNRSLSPTREPMTADTIFDVASLTKVVATTSCMMKLVEQGRVGVDEPGPDDSLFGIPPGRGSCPGLEWVRHGNPPGTERQAR